MREREAAINPVGQGKPLGRLQRVYKWDTKNLIPDDGFRDLTTLNQQDFSHPDKK